MARSETLIITTSLSFGCYSFWNPVKYCTNSTKTASYDILTCKISTHFNQDMYMARDDRDKEFSHFGNNQTGGELVKIKLVEMKAPNVFLATLSNGRSGLKTQGPIGK